MKKAVVNHAVLPAQSERRKGVSWAFGMLLGSLAMILFAWGTAYWKYGSVQSAMAYLKGERLNCRA